MKLENITQIRVRYADTDKMGVVYNGNYLTFFEVGRTELMRSKGMPYKELENAGYMLPLIEAHVNYKQSAFYDDILLVKAIVDLSEIRATLHFNYEIMVKDKLIATGWTVHTFVRMDNLKPVRPPQIFNNFVNSLKNN